MASIQSLRAEPAPARAADLLGDDEAGLLEHVDVLPHAGQRHAGRRRELGDRRGPLAESGEDAAPGLVGESGERPIEDFLVNHMVHNRTLNRKVQ